jgi:hypothetical protein
MPSYEHEGLIRLFRNRPELAPELLRDALRIELPAYSEARVESADLTDLEPAERHADLVVLLVDVASPCSASLSRWQFSRRSRMGKGPTPSRSAVPPSWPR